MLEDRMAVHYRVGSARSGSGSSRDGSARQTCGRVGSARPSSDTRRPKLHTGRPSSAPPGHSTGLHKPSWPATRLPNPFRTHEVSHLNLKVEGKSIRSVSYAPRRHQPVNRGSVRVVSSHGYPGPTRRRQFLSVHKSGAHERQEAGGISGYGTTYTLTHVSAQPKLYQPTIPYEEEARQPLEETFTKEDMVAFLEDKFGGTYTLRSGIGVAGDQGFTRVIHKPLEGEVDTQHFQSSSDSDHRTFTMGNFGKLECNTQPLSPRREGKVSGRIQDDHTHSFLAKREADTTSNEDSESTVMSLGQRIQLMAASPTYSSLPHRQDEGWDTEWKQLLKQNHELLLKLSSREDLRSPDNIPDSPKSVSVQDTAIQTLPCTDEVKGLVKTAEATYFSESVKTAEATYFSESGEEPLLIDAGESIISQSPECILEDIAEESSHSDRSSPGIVDHISREGKDVTLDSSITKSHQGKDIPTNPNTVKSIPEYSKKETFLTEEAPRCISKPSSLVEETYNLVSKSTTLREDGSSHTHESSSPTEAEFQFTQESSPFSKNIQSYITVSPPLTEDTIDFVQRSPLSVVIPNCVQKSKLPADKMEHAQHSSSPEQSKSFSPILGNTLVLEKQESCSPDHSNKSSSIWGNNVVLEKQDSLNTEDTPQHSRPSYADSSCTVDLPSYRAGAVTTFLMRSRFNPKEKPLINPQPSKDLLDALKMIEDEEKRNPEPNQEPPEKKKTMQDLSSPAKKVPLSPPSLMYSSSPAAGGEDVGAASLPAVQVLVEKVFLFTQDLAERWQLVDGHDCHEDLLSQLVEAERLLESICMHEGRKQDPQRNPDLHIKCTERARKRQEEAEGRIQKNLELIRKLMDDKRHLTEECEGLHQKIKQVEKRQADRTKGAEERHALEMKSLKERLTQAEQERREKWAQQKVKALKETTYRGLETKMKDLSAKHRDEVSLLKAQNWEAMREAEEKHRAQLHAQEETLRKKCEEEKEEACRRERDREQQRLEVQLRQCEQVSLARLEDMRRQQEKDLKALIEEHQHTMNRLHGEKELAVREASRERDRMKEEYEDRIRALTRSHQEELKSLQLREERNKNEWKEQFTKQEVERRQQAEREIRERLRRQRDKEIERAIREIQTETTAREKDQQCTLETKIKNMRERYESELSEMECSERAARTRYLEMKSILTQKEEEILYLRARLHTQDMELCDLQQMLQPPDD